LHAAQGWGTFLVVRREEETGNIRLIDNALRPKEVEATGGAIRIGPDFAARSRKMTMLRWAAAD
jgi:hypothetical protein